MRSGVVTHVAAHDRHVGLGLRRLVERDRRLRANLPARAERAREHTLDEPDRRVVGRALRLGHHEQPVDQLDAVARREDAGLDESLVLDALPSLELECRPGTGLPPTVNLVARSTTVNVTRL